MARLVADIESDGLLDTITRVWCIHTLDVDTGEERGFGPDEILAGLDHLQSADELILHNGIGFDLPALQQARLARILRQSEWDSKKGVQLWTT